MIGGCKFAMSAVFSSDRLRIKDSNNEEGSTECSRVSDSQPPYIVEYIAGLIEDERDLIGNSRYLSASIDSSVRAESVAWILKVRSCYGFQPNTAYLSINYFDRFLHSNNITGVNAGWPQQLLSVACLSLAAKMEEPTVPSLLALQVEGANYIFEPRNIQKMELVVLRVLDWRLRSISPFCYLNFFAFRIDPEGTYTTVLSSKATELILSTITVTNFLEYRPSCIAAAAILYAATANPKFSSINSLQAESWCNGLNNEKIASCYKLMRLIESSGRPNKQPKVLPQFRVMSRAGLSSGDSSSPSSYKRKKIE